MAKAREIKKRITAVRTTRKITRTMEMVSTSKLKRFQDMAVASRPYSEALGEVLKALRSSPAAKSHPLIVERTPLKRVGLVALTSNRGLCGAFNNSIARLTLEKCKEYKSKGIEVDLFLLGKKGNAFFRHRNLPAAYSDITLADQFTSEGSVEFARLLMQKFLSGEIDQVEVAYSRFLSAGSQSIRMERLLPLAAPTGSEREATETDFIFDPSADEIVEAVLPLALRSTVYRMVVENIASEHAARRNAMKLATDNADEMITFLTRSFNRERQSQITQELTEIIGGSNAIA
ncbi:ATP synthase F1 subunit gamma [bacterium]|nr:ATP synthase F1 subunit gamma [bacterium]